MRETALLLLLAGVAGADERGEIKARCAGREAELFETAKKRGTPEGDRAYDMAARAVEDCRDAIKGDLERLDKREAEDSEQLKADRARLAQVEAVRQSPRLMSVAFGAAICAARQVRSASIAEIAKEKKYARIGGYENKSKLYELQRRIRWADEQEAAERAAAKGAHIAPFPCTNGEVKTAIACTSSGSECADPYATIATFVSSYEDDNE